MSCVKLFVTLSLIVFSLNSFAQSQEVDLTKIQCVTEKFLAASSATADKVVELGEKLKQTVSPLEQSKIVLELSRTERALDQLAPKFISYRASGYTSIPDYAADCVK